MRDNIPKITGLRLVAYFPFGISREKLNIPHPADAIFFFRIKRLISLMM